VGKFAGGSDHTNTLLPLHIYTYKGSANNANIGLWAFAINDKLKKLKDDVIVILEFNVYKRATQFTKSLSSPA
jgi:hypothetical protein